MPPVTIVILNWNGRHWLETFLPAVRQTTYPDHEILVVDNASTDDSCAWLRSHHPEVRLLELDQNYGFAEGNNRALPHLDTPYFVLLNSDVEVTPGWLEPLVAWMESHPQAAAVQPKIRAYHARDHFEYAGAAGGYLDRLGYPFCRGRVFDTLEEDRGQYDDPHPVLWATGACMLLRTSVVRELDLFDRHFFAHMEEIDFCWRALNHGYTIWCQPNSVVYHVGGGTLPQGNPRKTFLNVRNSLAMLHKNLPQGKVFPQILARLLLDGVWGIKLLLSGDLASIKAIYRAHWAYLRRLRYWQQRRYDFPGGPPEQWPSQGLWPGSVVWAYFVRRKKQWSALRGTAQLPGIGK
jgi:GT2 family glycosyltransferase